MTRFKTMVAVFTVVSSFCFIGCVQARPPRPGPNFVWIAPHPGPAGKIIPGHWKYTGVAPPPGRHWVPGHFNPAGRWVPGHWSG